MDSNNYALLIGVNHYQDPAFHTLRFAEKDCHDLAQVLTDSDTGCFPKQNIVQLIGERATLANLQEALFSHVLRRSGVENVVFYFSGHGFRTTDQLAYLATTDTSLEQLDRNPLAGLSFETLHDHIFRRSQAKNVVFILDACYSGSIIPVTSRGTKSQSDYTAVRNSELIDADYFNGTRGRVAIISCPPDAHSRELAEYKNGLFTHHLLNGLRESASEQPSGEVTIDSLLSYVRQHMPLDQPFGRYGQDFDRVVLTKPRKQSRAGQTGKLYSRAAVHGSSSQISRPVPVSLVNVLDQFEPFIRQFIDSLDGKAIDASRDVEHVVLEAIRDLTGASLACCLRTQDSSGWVVRATALSPQVTDPGDYVDNLIGQILPILHESRSTHHVLGSSLVIQSPGLRKGERAIIVRLRSGLPGEVLVLGGVPDQPLVFSDVFAQVMEAAYLGTQGYTVYRPALITTTILDHIKTLYSQVPDSFYKWRYSVFADRLKDMTVHFQPILRLSRSAPAIESFEALARDPATFRVPNDLFTAAELWGRRFRIDLDMHFLNKSVVQYGETLKSTSGRRRPEDIADLSVNVYPDSLIRTAYFKALQSLLNEEQIPRNKLILELSEKQPFPEVIPGDGVAVDARVQNFRHVLERYVAELRIGFAIDDFGVGHSSLHRLIALHPSYVKIDRQILQQEYALDAIGFIHNLITTITSKQHLRSARIVVEGYDISMNSRFTLGDLYDIGIEYVQGYVVSEPRMELFRVPEDLRTHLLLLMRSRMPPAMVPSTDEAISRPH